MYRIRNSLEVAPPSLPIVSTTMDIVVVDLDSFNMYSTSNS